MDESDAWAEEKEPWGQHYFSPWGLMRLHMLRDTESDRSKQSTTRRIWSPPLPSLPSHQTHIDKLESVNTTLQQGWLQSGRKGWR